MSAPITAAEAPLSALDLFPTYETADDFKAATGKNAGAYDPSKPLKTWFDPQALTAPNGLRASDGAFFSTTAAIYPTLSVKELADHSYQAVTDILELSRQDAAALNVPESSSERIGAASPPVAQPRRGLAPGEALAYSKNMMGGVVVVNLAIQAAQQKAQDIAEGKFTADDRALLERIAAKLGA